MFDEDAQTDAEAIQDSGPFDIQTALLRYSKLVIVGYPGSGKSTFLKYIALMLARSVLQANPGIALEALCLQEPLPIPLFVSCWEVSDFLRKCDKVDRPRLMEFLYSVWRRTAFEFRPVTSEKPLESGGCCLLFDGLDEVPTEHGWAVVSRLLEDCVRRFSQNRLVVTSRIRAYTGDTIKGSHPLRYQAIAGAEQRNALAGPKGTLEEAICSRRLIKLPLLRTLTLRNTFSADGTCRRTGNWMQVFLIRLAIGQEPSGSAQE